MADLVAWSPIRSAKNNGTNKEPEWEAINVKPGETVTQDSLGVDDDGWRQLVESGAVRVQSYPDMPDTYQSSPVDFLRESAVRAAEGGLASVENSQENIDAILAANAASTGTALLTQEGYVAGDLEQPPEIPTPDAGSGNPTPVFKRNDAGDLLASDDDGASWRVATEAERASQT